MDVETWTIDMVCEWAKEIIDTEDTIKLKEQKIDGEALLDMTYDDFERCGIPIGPAKKLDRATKKLKSKERRPEASMLSAFTSRTN